MEQRSKLIGGVAIGGAVLLGTVLLMRAHSRRRLRQRYQAGVMMGQHEAKRAHTASEAADPADSWELLRKRLKRLPKWMRKVGPDRP
jgi:hypothetical protein